MTSIHLAVTFVAASSWVGHASNEAYQHILHDTFWFEIGGLADLIFVGCATDMRCLFSVVPDCSKQCASGYVTGDDGGAACQCVQPPQLCAGLVNCSLSTSSCMFGLRDDERGCPKCKCRKCPKLNCSKKCPHGLVFVDGCRQCRCRGALTAVVSAGIAVR